MTRGRCFVFVLLTVFAASPGRAQTPPAPAVVRLLQPARVYDGVTMHEGWAVVVRGKTIEAAGPLAGLSVPAGAERVALPGLTLLPGLIEGHSHLLLHPYNETTWNDQVLKESVAYRVARATVSARDTLMAGITTVRDLGTEGAGYADVGLKKSIDDGIIPGPRMLVSGPAMVATGTYGPKGFAPEFTVPQGAEEADGIEGVTRVARNQIGHGIDFVKIYADYRWGPNGEARPTFTVEEIAAIVEVAKSSGRYVAAHAGTPEGHAARRDGRRRDHRSRRCRHPGDLGADGREGRHVLPDARRARRDRAICGLEEGAGARAGAPAGEAPHVSGGDEGRREAVFRRRRRRLPARR